MNSFLKKIVFNFGPSNSKSSSKIETTLSILNLFTLTLLFLNLNNYFTNVECLKMLCNLFLSNNKFEKL